MLPKNKSHVKIYVRKLMKTKKEFFCMYYTLTAVLTSDGSIYIYICMSCKTLDA